MPWILHIPIPNIHIEKYFHENIIGEDVDCHLAYIGRSAFIQDTVRTAYVDLVLDEILPGGVQNDRPSQDLQIRN